MVKVFISGDIVNFDHPDGRVCHDDLSEIIQSADYAVCNFEAPVSGFGVPEAKSGSHLNQCSGTIEGLKKQGFDMLLLANNHIMDYGLDALKATIEKAKENGFDIIGVGLDAAEAYRPLIKELKT